MKSCFFAFTLFCSAAPSGASAPPVAHGRALQAAVLAKVLSFDRSLAGVTPTVMVLAQSPAASAQANPNTESPVPAHSMLVEALRGARLAATVVREPEAERHLRNFNVLCLSRPPSDTLLNAAARDSVLTFSTEPELVRQGKASVAVGLIGGKPKIFINLARTRAEGHEFSAPVLRLARVIR